MNLSGHKQEVRWYKQERARVRDRARMGSIQRVRERRRAISGVGEIVNGVARCR